MGSLDRLSRRRRARPSAGSASGGSTASGSDSSGADPHSRLLEPVPPHCVVGGGGHQSSDGGETLTDRSKCACIYLPPNSTNWHGD
jgi:hypothetical protein